MGQQLQHLICAVDINQWQLIEIKWCCTPLHWVERRDSRLMHCGETQNSEIFRKNMGNQTMELKNRVSTYAAIQCTINTEIRLIIYIVHCSFCKKLNRLCLISWKWSEQSSITSIRHWIIFEQIYIYRYRFRMTQAEQIWTIYPFQTTEIIYVPN